MNGEFVRSFNTHSDLVHRWNQEAVNFFFCISQIALFSMNFWKITAINQITLMELFCVSTGHETKTHTRTLHAASRVKFIFRFVDNRLNSNERISVCARRHEPLLCFYFLWLFKSGHFTKLSPFWKKKKTQKDILNFFSFFAQKRQNFIELKPQSNKIDYDVVHIAQVFVLRADENE